MSQTPNKQASSRAKEVTNLRVELERLEREINDLKVLYEQYFSGILVRPPDTEHNILKQLIRTIRKAPFKNSALNYRLKSLEHRYNTYNTYWQRVLREKDEGRYSRDVYKANLRERKIHEDAQRQTAKGAAEHGMKELFRAYKLALDKETGKSHELDFDSFRSSLLEKAKTLQKQSSGGKLSFKVVVKDGKVLVQAKIKGEQ
jgi:hypothetical protein